MKTVLISVLSALVGASAVQCQETSSPDVTVIVVDESGTESVQADDEGNGSNSVESP